MHLLATPVAVLTSSVFPIDNKLESWDWLRAGGICQTQEKSPRFLEETN